MFFYVLHYSLSYMSELDAQTMAATKEYFNHQSFSRLFLYYRFIVWSRKTFKMSIPVF